MLFESHRIIKTNDTSLEKQTEIVSPTGTHRPNVKCKSGTTQVAKGLPCFPDNFSDYFGLLRQPTVDRTAKIMILVAHQ